MTMSAVTAMAVPKKMHHRTDQQNQIRQVRRNMAEVFPNQVERTDCNQHNQYHAGLTSPKW
jgi:hypothetical protein